MSSKKKSPKEIIEKDDHRIEHAYVKFPGMELMRTTLTNAPDHVTFNVEEIKELWSQANNVKYTKVHNHPSGRPLPSRGDLNHFLVDDDVKAFVIIQRDDRSGEVEGYFIMRKTKDYRPFGYSQMSEDNKVNDIALSKAQLPLIEMTQSYDAARYESSPSSEKALLELDKMAKKYSLKYRFVPVKGKVFLKNKSRFGKLSALERAVAVFMAGGLVYLFSKILLSKENILLSPPGVISIRSLLFIVFICSAIFMILSRYAKKTSE